MAENTELHGQKRQKHARELDDQSLPLKHSDIPVQQLKSSGAVSTESLWVNGNPPSALELKSQGLEDKAQAMCSGQVWSLVQLKDWRQKSIPATELNSHLKDRQKEMKRCLLKSNKTEDEMPL
mmetsp:Transcript_11126/g.14531  ORF Transcript_11126/g.14531 Transcript_11126/m.14531 type:complete len:123 (-) Transcript_11126:362-730(-)|eukprot:CAMPEP_0117790078 /NCGR_PEP_ID=MMETSP0948-20121206/8009_1 /TAXON_ID=44440 /ORGANISM="Chattonella subsalsa, Strain CCMP2191" /LENGTH=122 /DNA_ID=CAMNT_0005619795 /DNA_START=192 /DNA_END=560 /DNA_ORIENTATION=-